MALSFEICEEEKRRIENDARRSTKFGIGPHSIGVRLAPSEIKIKGGLGSFQTDAANTASDLYLRQEEISRRLSG